MIFLYRYDIIKVILMMIFYERYRFMSKTNRLNISEMETQKQIDIIEKLKNDFENKYKETNKKKTFHVETFGCQ
ncbi:MAG TPA: hypothetical protein GXZ90_10895, partial [Clostridiales bacterium]|nr:hypothetical protein [Clostridiales bacterium]